MDEITQKYCFWSLVFIHFLILIEAIFVVLCKKNQHSQVFDISPNSDNDRVKEIDGKDEFMYMKFPKQSLRVFILVLKKNHLFLKIYFRQLSWNEGLLEVVSKNIVLIAILGITGIEYSSLPSINPFFAGILSGLLARIFHFFYCALEAKQGPLQIDISSKDKLVISVESEVIRRLNIHRTMRRVLGYLLMSLYYGGNIYYTFKYLYSIQNPYLYYWFISFIIGICFVFFILEPIKAFLQIEAVNYLKNAGGSKTIEAFSRFLVSEELLCTFD